MRRLSFCLLLLLLATAGCDGDPLAPGTPEEAFARWRAAGLTHYQVEQRLTIICNVCDGGTAERWATVTVQDGVVTAVEGADEAFTISTETNAPAEAFALTVDEVFARVLAPDDYRTHVETAFDERLGYPTRFFWMSGDGEVREEIRLRNLRAR